MISLLFAAGLAAHPAMKSNADQFDLICKGKRTAVLSSKVTGIEDTEGHLRIDLKAKIWCGNKCEHVYDIEGAITPAEIVLTDSDHDQFTGHHSDDSEDHFVIDRSTGNYTDSSFFKSYGLKSGGFTQGSCERAPFSGMPTTKF